MAKNKEHSARSKGDRRLCFERAERRLRSKAHEPVLLERSEFTGECAELLTESRELGTAARHSRGTGGIPPVLLFFCRRFLFQIKRKCRNAESVKSLIIVGREGSKPIINNLQLLCPCIGYADIGQPQGLSLRSVKSKISCRLRGSGASRSPHPTNTRQ